MTSPKHSPSPAAPVYDPQEDSFLLQIAIAEHFKQHPKVKHALDMGTGSGIIALTLCDFAEEVLGLDISPAAVNATINAAQQQKIKNLTVSVSDLFSIVKKKELFDIIAFNPPYLPFNPEQDAEDVALSAGKKGNETIIRFLKQAKDHLNKHGIIFLLFSSLSYPEEILRTMDEESYKYEKVLSEKHFMEELGRVYALEITLCFSKRLQDFLKILL